ncbi:MAG: VOC family protein [Candidatus Dojkabacteria bacterium]|nr:MAG: VOC family protein [Candidatus Dojkabacteria bacterium]
MKIDAVGVTTTNMTKTVEFYTQLGFDFTGLDLTEGHIEPATPDRSARLMIDSVEIIRDILGEEPRPANHSPFAIRYDSPEEVDAVASKVKDNGFVVVKEPWDAFWNQRYAVVEDPDGYRVDLYADLSR